MNLDSAYVTLVLLCLEDYAFSRLLGDQLLMSPQYMAKRE